MARITSLTVFIWVTLIVYTITSGMLVSALYGKSYTSPYSTSLVEEGAQYQYSQLKNITNNGADVVFDVFTPDRMCSWNKYALLHPNKLFFYRKDTWFGILWIQLSGSPIHQDDIISKWDENKNYSKFVFDAGGAFQTDVYFYPLMGENNTFIYYPINESISHGWLTVLMGTNLTSYAYFDVGMLTGVVTGFASYGAPAPISIVIGGIWWIMFALGIVKLVVG